MIVDDETRQELQDLLAGFELAAAAADEEAARQALRSYIAAARGVPCEGSLGDLVGDLATAAEGQKASAVLLLRALAVPGVLRPNATNGLSRMIVIVVSKAIPDAFDFAKVDPKLRQTHERYAALEQVHGVVLARLEPLRIAYSSIDSLLAAKADLMGSLRNPFVRQYLGPFRGAEVAEAVDALLAKVERVRRMESSLTDDVDAVVREIAGRRDKAAGSPSFLIADHLLPFLDCVAAVVSDLLARTRSRLRTRIELASSGTDQQKRQPLHEVGRALRIIVPLRATGPGDAIDVVARVGSASEHVLVDDVEMPLATISPGSFALAVNAEVIEPCTALTLEVQVSWSEVGSTTSNDEIFEVKILAQRPDVDWPRYKYTNPYAEAPADGSRFVGRTDQVHAVVARILQEPMEPTYIDGQKRVGKTSLAQTAVDEAVSNAGDRRLEKLYLLWGNLWRRIRGPRSATSVVKSRSSCSDRCMSATVIPAASTRARSRRCSSCRLWCRSVSQTAGSS